MTAYPEVPLAQVLEPSSAFEPVEPDITYETAGIYSYGRGLFKRPAIDGSETNYSKYNRIREGQFIYSKLFGWEGALATVTAEFDGLHVSHEFPTFKIRSEQADLRYMTHLAAWEGLHAKLRDQGTGMGSRRQRVNVDRLLATTVPLPDLPEQQRIAGRLDSAAETITKARHLRDEAKRLRSAVLESIFRSHEDSASIHLGEVLRLERFPVEIEPVGEYIQIGIRSFGKGIFLRDRMSGIDLSKLKYFEIHPGRLIVSNIMAWEGAIAVSDDRHAGCIGSHRFLSYAAVGDVDVRYLNYYFQTRNGRENVRGTSTGTVLRNQTLSMKDFENLGVPLPPLDEQQSVVAQLDAITKTDSLAQCQQEALGTYRKAFLNAAFTGGL